MLARGRTQLQSSHVGSTLEGVSCKVVKLHAFRACAYIISCSSVGRLRCIMVTTNVFTNDARKSSVCSYHI
jgi:hypothetical protein